MQVRFNKWVGILYLMLSLFLGGIVILTYITDGFDFLGKSLAPIFQALVSLLPFICFWVGVSMLIGRVCFKVDQRSLVVYAAIGPLKKTYHFQFLEEIKVDKNKVYLNQDGKWKRIAMEYLAVNRKDWDAFVRFIQRPG
jgi:hypothetical protein